MQYGSLCYTVGLCCLSILCTVVCACLPQTPSLSLPPTFPCGEAHVCFLCLRVYFYFVYKFISTTFSDSTCKGYHSIFVFLKLKNREGFKQNAEVP